MRHFQQVTKIAVSLTECESPTDIGSSVRQPPTGVSGSARTGKRGMPLDQRQISKVRSVHDQVSRERLREEHLGGFRRVISARNYVKNSVKLCAERAPETSPDSDLSYRKQTCSRAYTCPVNRWPLARQLSGQLNATDSVIWYDFEVSSFWGYR